MFSGHKLELVVGGGGGGVEVEDSETPEKAYKSCFARSVVVNSKFQEARAANSHPVRRQVVQQHQLEIAADLVKKDPCPEIVNLVDNKSQEYTSRNVRNRSRKNSVDSSSSGPDFSVENLFLKTQVETLQWQLKQTEESRQMYQAVMKQVITFLERAHRSLEHLGTRLNSGKQNVVRSLSHHEMSTNSDDHLTETMASSENNGDYSTYRDFTWRRRKKLEASPEEIPPEKLSQEAFRLLRTAESLLNIHEPLLGTTASFNRSPSPAPISSQFKDSPEKHFQRPPFAASSPQLACSERSFSRKAVLRRQHALKCNSFHAETLSNKSLESHDGNIFDPRDFSIISNENSGNNSRRNSVSSQKSNINDRCKSEKGRNEPEKSVTPPMSSVSSAEDESGFSSMNSFQELGIPIVPYEETTKSKDALLKSMLHENEYNSAFCPSSRGGMQNSVVSHNGAKEKQSSQNDYKLWQTPDSYSHKRWNSTPVENVAPEGKQPLKVLWV